MPPALACVASATDGVASLLRWVLGVLLLLLAAAVPTALWEASGESALHDELALVGLVAAQLASLLYDGALHACLRIGDAAVPAGAPAETRRERRHAPPLPASERTHQTGCGKAARPSTDPYQA